MELNPKEKNMIIIAMMTRMETVLESIGLETSDYWEKKLEESNNLYKRFMGSDYEVYTNYINKKNERFIIQ